MPLQLILLIVSIIVQVGVSLIQQAQAAKQNSKPSGYRGSYSSGGDVALSLVVGTFGLAGKLEYRNSWGTVGGAPNAYLVDVISVSDIVCTALTGLYVNGKRETVSGSGHTTQGYPVTTRRNGSSDRLWIEFLDGTQTSANSYLTGKFGGDANRPWTSSMIGRGISYVTLTALVDRTIWNGIPNYMIEVQGAALYDPRKDSTVGGSGSQRLATPSTWTFSDNPAVIIYNIKLGFYDVAGNWLWGDRSLRNTDGSINSSAVAYALPYANWAAAMNVCDQDINLKAGGTQKRFRAGRSISVDETPVDVINEFLVGCTGLISEAAGQYTIAIGDPGSASFTFTDADVIVSETQELDPFPAVDDAVNGATASYLEPSQAWEFKETAPYYNATYEAADYGRRSLAGLHLGTVFDGKQAQRVQQATVKDARRFARHVTTLPPQYGINRPLSVGGWTSTRNGYSSKAFLVTAAAEAENGNIVFGLKELDPTDHDWTPGTDEQDTSFAPLTPIIPGAQLMTGWTAVPATMVDPSGNGWLPTVQVGYAGGLEDVKKVRVQVRESWGSKLLIFDGQIDYDPEVSSPSVVVNASFLPNALYEARGKFLPFSGRVTRWSNQDVSGVDGAWLGVTTPNVSPVPPNSIFLQQLGQDLQNVVGTVVDPSLGGSIPDQINALNQRMELLASAILDVAATSKQRLDVLSVSRNGAAAAIIRNETAIVTETEARATAIEEVVASFGDSFADGFLVFDALVDAGASTATVSAKVRAVADGALAQAAWMLRAALFSGTPESTFGIFADRFAIFNDIDTTAVSPFSIIGGIPYLNNAIIKNGTLDGGKILNATLTGSKMVGGTITGSLIAPLTITGALIANATLTGAKIVDATITGAKIGHLEVDTINIADAAVTQLVSAKASSGNIAYTSSFKTVKSITVTTGNFNIKLGAYLDWTVFASATTQNHTLQLDITIGSDTVVIDTATHNLVGGQADKFMLTGALPPLPDGSYTVRLRHKSANSGLGGQNHSINYVALSADWPDK